MGRYLVEYSNYQSHINESSYTKRSSCRSCYWSRNASYVLYLTITKIASLWQIGHTSYKKERNQNKVAHDYDPVVVVSLSTTAGCIGHPPSLHPPFPSLFQYLLMPHPPSLPPLHMALEYPMCMPNQMRPRATRIPTIHFQRCPWQQPAPHIDQWQHHFISSWFFSIL